MAVAASTSCTTRPIRAANLHTRPVQRKVSIPSAYICTTLTRDALVSRQNFLGPNYGAACAVWRDGTGAADAATRACQSYTESDFVGVRVRPGLQLGVGQGRSSLHEAVGVLGSELVRLRAEFVFPWLREFPGPLLPSPSTNLQTPAGMSGVVLWPSGLRQWPSSPKSRST